MEQLPEPDYTVALDMSKIMRQTLYLTGFALIVLFTLQMMIYQFFDYSFNLFTLGLDLFILSVGYLLLIALHEFFHLLGFRIFSSVPWRKMKVGVNFKMGIAYATTPQLMVNRDIQKSLLLPFWMTGVLPALIGLYINSGLLLTLSALLIGGAAGDFSMYRELKKLPGHWLIKDHPTEPKLFIFSPDKITENN